LGFSVQGSKLEVKDLWSRVQGLRVSGFRVWGSGFSVQGLGFGV
jgi:hypothetical protein